MEVKIIKIPEQGYASNSYIVYSETNNKGAIIDPGQNAEIYLKACEEHGINIEKILLTHGHADHILGVEALREETGAKVYIHSADSEMLTDARANFSSMMFPMPIEFEADIILKDGDTIQLDEGVKFEVIHTPGHTLGGVCFVLGDIIFTGDTLFKSSIGRTDFPGGDYAQIISSIKERIFSYPDTTTLLPGHGENSSVILEKQYNPFLR